MANKAPRAENVETANTLGVQNFVEKCFSDATLNETLEREKLVTLKNSEMYSDEDSDSFDDFPDLDDALDMENPIFITESPMPPRRQISDIHDPPRRQDTFENRGEVPMEVVDQSSSRAAQEHIHTEHVNTAETASTSKTDCSGGQKCDEKNRKAIVVEKDSHIIIYEAEMANYYEAENNFLEVIDTPSLQRKPSMKYKISPGDSQIRSKDNVESKIFSDLTLKPEAIQLGNESHEEVHFDTAANLSNMPVSEKTVGLENVQILPDTPDSRIERVLPTNYVLFEKTHNSPSTLTESVTATKDALDQTPESLPPNGQKTSQEADECTTNRDVEIKNKETLLIDQQPLEMQDTESTEEITSKNNSIDKHECLSEAIEIANNLHVPDLKADSAVIDQSISENPTDTTISVSAANFACEGQKTEDKPDMPVKLEIVKTEEYQEKENTVLTAAAEKSPSMLINEMMIANLNQIEKPNPVAISLAASEGETNPEKILGNSVEGTEMNSDPNSFTLIVTDTDAQEQTNEDALFVSNQAKSGIDSVSVFLSTAEDFDGETCQIDSSDSLAGINYSANLVTEVNDDLTSSGNSGHNAFSSVNVISTSAASSIMEERSSSEDTIVKMNNTDSHCLGIKDTSELSDTASQNVENIDARTCQVETEPKTTVSLSVAENETKSTELYDTVPPSLETDTKYETKASFDGGESTELNDAVSPSIDTLTKSAPTDEGTETFAENETGASLIKTKKSELPEIKSTYIQNKSSVAPSDETRETTSPYVPDNETRPSFIETKSKESHDTVPHYIETEFSVDHCVKTITRGSPCVIEHERKASFDLEGSTKLNKAESPYTDILTTGAPTDEATETDNKIGPFLTKVKSSETENTVEPYFETESCVVYSGEATSSSVKENETRGKNTETDNTVSPSVETEFNVAISVSTAETDSPYVVENKRQMSLTEAKVAELQNTGFPTVETQPGLAPSAETASPSVLQNETVSPSVETESSVAPSASTEDKDSQSVLRNETGTFFTEVKNTELQNTGSHLVETESIVAPYAETADTASPSVGGSEKGTSLTQSKKTESQIAVSPFVETVTAGESAEATETVPPSSVEKETGASLTEAKTIELQNTMSPSIETKFSAAPSTPATEPVSKKEASLDEAKHTEHQNTVSPSVETATTVIPSVEERAIGAENEPEISLEGSKSAQLQIILSTSESENTDISSAESTQKVCSSVDENGTGSELAKSKSREAMFSLVEVESSVDHPSKVPEASHATDNEIEPALPESKTTETHNVLMPPSMETEYTTLHNNVKETVSPSPENKIRSSTDEVNFTEKRSVEDTLDKRKNIETTSHEIETTSIVLAEVVEADSASAGKEVLQNSLQKVKNQEPVVEAERIESLNVSEIKFASKIILSTFRS